MNVEIFNWSKFLKYCGSPIVTKKTLSKILVSEFSGYNISELGIIFVEEEYMVKLNSEFRGIDSVTDVLSFNIDTKPLVGEVYICPKFVNSNFSGEKYFEEVMRNIVHGFLHVLGFDHNEKFISEYESKEDMFVKQEYILHNILNEINRRSG